MISAFRNTCTVFSHYVLNPKPYFPLLLISTQNFSVPSSTFTSSNKARCCSTFLANSMAAGDLSNPSSEKLEKQFEDFRHHLEESGNLRERIRAVATEIESVTRVIYASLLLVHQSRPVAGIKKISTHFLRSSLYKNLFILFVLKWLMRFVSK